ncbi:MAG: DNA polymerase III subunit beta [Rickettsiella sp.]|nr:DNA polymerase III subunit beta [Rickettsiella sp.]
MQFTINREALLRPLQAVNAVIERRQTLPILANVFLNLEADVLFLFGTDMEVELSGRIVLEKEGKNGKTTAPARKLMDICRSLPEGSDLNFQQKGDKLILKSGRSRFNLSTLPASDFPRSEESDKSSEQVTFNLSQKKLRSLMEATNFAMAQQDVRYYLNGMLWELDQMSLRAVATDGHRLATSIKDLTVESPSEVHQTQSPSIDEKDYKALSDKQFLIPRKAIYELSRLLDDDEDNITVLLCNNQLRVTMQDYIFTSKLIEGKFPDYDRVIPKSGDKILTVDRDKLKSSLVRVGALLNDKHKSICLEMKDKTLRIFASNLQEEAEDHLDAIYSGETITIAFNISYLLDVLNSLPVGFVKIILTSADASVRLQTDAESSSTYVIMPMRI